MKEKLEIFNQYIKAGFRCFLVDDLTSLLIEDEVILNNDAGLMELNGHYEGIEFVAPKWYLELMNKKTKILVIKDINKVSFKEQRKFLEIIKYRQVSTFELTDDVIIVLTLKNLEENKIEEEVYSLCVHI